MKYLLFVTLDFAKGSALLAKQLLALDPQARFCAVHASTPNVKQAFLSELPPSFPIDPDIPSVNDLEFQWVENDNADDLPFFEDLLGSRAVNYCFICDRELSDGYLTGGRYPKSTLRVRTGSMQAKRNYFSAMFRFIHDYLKQARPDAVFFPTVERGFDMAFYYLANAQGIPFRQIMSIRRGELSTFSNSFLESFPHVRHEFARRLPDLDSLANSPDVAAAREDILKFRSKPAPPPYKAVAIDALFARRKTRDLFILLLQALMPGYKPKGIHEPYPLHTLLDYFMPRLKRRRMWSTQSWRKADEITRPFVYYPLHYDPETTTLAFSPMLANQFVVLEALSKSIPLSWTIAVKEHISMLGRRPRGFYEKLAKIPKVELVHPFQDTFSLIQASRLTATITGTVGMEAMMLGRVPLYFGYTFIQDVGAGFVRCADIERLPDAVTQALEAEPVPLDRLALYFSALYRHSFALPTTLAMESYDSYAADSALAHARDLAEQLFSSLDGRFGDESRGAPHEFALHC